MNNNVPISLQYKWFSLRLIHTCTTTSLKLVSNALVRMNGSARERSANVWMKVNEWKDEQDKENEYNHVKCLYCIVFML